MNAQQLFTKDGTPASAWLCGVCGLLHSEQTPIRAERCCWCHHCGELGELAEFSIYRQPHTACKKKFQDELRAQRLDAAGDVTHEYSGPVYLEATDEFYDSLEDAADDVEDDNPVWAYACSESPVIDEQMFHDAINARLADSFNDAYKHIYYPKEFDVAVKNLVEVNSTVVNWEPDFTRKIRIVTVAECRQEAR